MKKLIVYVIWFVLLMTAIPLKAVAEVFSGSQLIDPVTPLRQIPIDISLQNADVRQVHDILINQCGVPCSLEDVWPNGSKRVKYTIHATNALDLLEKLTQGNDETNYIWSGKPPFYHIVPRRLFRDPNYALSSKIDIRGGKNIEVQKVFDVLFSLPVMKNGQVNVVQPLAQVPALAVMDADFKKYHLRYALGETCEKAKCYWIAEGTPDKISLKFLPLPKLNPVFLEEENESGNLPRKQSD